MYFCIICLSRRVSKNLTQVNSISEAKTRSGSEIMKYCLDIQIPEDCNKEVKLCLKCYRKLLLFFKFKQLAHETNAYLSSRNQKSHEDPNIPIVFLDENVVKTELVCEKSHLFEDCLIKLEPDFDLDTIKKEDNIQDFADHNDSEDEVLFVLKKHKNEKSAENDEEVVKKKRGRKKAILQNNNTGQVCDLCGKTVLHLKEHLRKHRPATEREQFKCKGCTKAFSSLSARNKHYTIKHLGLKSKCEICNKSFVNLTLHRLRMHESDQLRYSCASCPRRFINQSALEFHATLHSSHHQHACPDCDKRFRLKATLVQHTKQVHEKQRPHLCQYCSMSFFKKYHLQNHLRRHTKERPFKCRTCDKAFTTTSQRKMHEAIHSGIKTHACSLCDMTFYCKGALQAHMVTHTKERRHACQYCGRGFGRTDHRRRHEITAHERHVAIQSPAL